MRVRGDRAARRAARAKLAPALLAALVFGACSHETPDASASGAAGQQHASAPAAKAPPVQLLELPALEAAIRQNLQRGAILALWATW